MLIRGDPCVHTLTGCGILYTNQSNVITNSFIIPNSSLCGSHSYRFSLRFLTLRTTRKLKSALISCKNHSHGSFDPNSHHHQSEDEYLEASLLISETVKHYHLRKQGFREEVKQFSGQFVPFSAQVKDPTADVSIGLGILLRFRNPTIFLKISCEGDFLLPIVVETVKHYHLRKQGFREEVKQFSGQFVPLSAQVKDPMADVSIGSGILLRFRNPTIFLKISCEGDFLLPIVVGELAVEKLIDSLDEDEQRDFTNQFRFVRNLVVELGYEVKMVKITKRVVNTYFASVYFGKVGERESFCVDARPSDAINVAQRCKAPIYVNKQIVVADALKFAYGTGRVRDRKPIYDVLLDSPMEGPDSLVEELNLVRNMKLAVKEERYNDAAMWRDKLVKLRNSGR